MALTSNKSVLKWVDEMVALTKPDKVVWIDGSEEQLEALRAEACSTGEMIKLNEEKLPGCYLHRSAVNDVARVEGRTFICTRKEEDAGPTNNWMDPKEAYEKLGKLFDGAMKGRTMYVIPYCMAHVGSPFAKVGIELTDSIYVVLSMAIMTRIGQKVLDFLGDMQVVLDGFQLCVFPLCLLDESDLLGCLFNGSFEVFEIDWLGREVEGSLIHGTTNILHIAVGRYHNAF